MLFGTLVAETILASVHVRAHRQAGHMGASDLIKTLQNTLRGGGRPHMSQGHLKTTRASREDPYLHATNGAITVPISSIARSMAM